MQNTLIDAGPLIALFDKDDQYHQKIELFIHDYKGHLVTTWPVITEVMYMLQFNVNAQIDFLQWLARKAIKIMPLSLDYIERFIELLKKYSDLPMDFADGSLIVVSELLNIKNIITIDSDYYVYRMKDKKYFNNLFKESLK